MLREEHYVTRTVTTIVFRTTVRAGAITVGSGTVTIQGETTFESNRGGNDGGESDLMSSILCSYSATAMPCCERETGIFFMAGAAGARVR